MNFWRNALWFIPAGLLALVIVTFVFGHSPGHKNLLETQSVRPQPPKHQMDTASALLGKNVETPNGELVGSVYDFVIDAHSGRVVFVLVATGGFAGMGMKLKAVPPGALSQATAKRDTLALNLEPHRWAEAPVVSKSHLDELKDPVREQAIYQYYQQVRLPPTGHSDGNAPLIKGSNNLVGTELRLARSLIGQSVMNNRNRELGHVADLTVDLNHPASTRAIFRPVSTNGSIALPISAFTISGSSLLLNCVCEPAEDSLWAGTNPSFETNL